IPAGGFGRIVEPDRELVAATEGDMRREVHAPAVVAIRPAADQLAIEPDGGMGHGAVQVEMDAASLLRGRDVERAPVPADAPARQPAHAAVGTSAMKGPAMAQSCGSVTGCPALSSKSARR